MKPKKLRKTYKKMLLYTKECWTIRISGNNLRAYKKLIRSHVTSIWNYKRNKNEAKAKTS